MILGSVLNPVNPSMIAVALIPIGIALVALGHGLVGIRAVSGDRCLGHPVIGRLVDIYGPRRLFLAGTALVGAAGIVGALAPTLGVLVGARMLLGLGTCAGYPAAMSLIRSEARRTGRDDANGLLTVPRSG